MSHDLFPAHPTFGNQVLGGDNEIPKAVGFVCELAILVPAPTFFRAAADMSEDKDKTAIDQREAVGVEARGDREPVGAVAIEQAGRPAVRPEILAVEDGEGNDLAVRGVCHQSAGHIAARVVTTWNV